VLDAMFWATPFIATVRRSSGVPVAFEHIPAREGLDPSDYERLGQAGSSGRAVGDS